MKLLIVESPNKCGKLSKFLGSEFRVAASVGHIRSIPKKGMNIDIKAGFVPVFEITDDKKKVVKELKSLADEATKIYLATDPDREGEAIAWHIYDILSEKNKKKCVRASFHEISSTAVKKAIETARDIDMNLVNAQKARQVLDRLIGYKISPILWYTVGQGTSAGRVQSIALKLVCQREKEINDFKPQDFWYIDALMQCKNGEFWARVMTKDKDNRYFEDKISQDDFEKLKTAKFNLGKIEKKERIVDPYPPFDTSSLQTSCSSIFGWSVKKTATLSQGLYEQGRVTYIRSDSYSIAEEALEEVRGFIKKNTSPEYLPSKPNVYHKKSKAAAQEAHECIRPIHCEDKGDDIEEADAQKLYKLIRSRFIACQMTPMVVDTVVYTVKSSTKHDLIAKGQSIKFDGWYKVYKYTAAKEEVLPEAQEKEELTLKDIKKIKNSTQPPPRYNEGSLVKKMEGEGVGRPSTYASIMESIQKRGYVEKVKGKKGALGSTPLGMRVFDYLDPHFKSFFMDVSFTASVEDDLDKITRGEKDYLGVVGTVYNLMQEEIKKAKNDPNSPEKQDLSTGEKCTVCNNGSIVKKHGKFGDFFSCDKYPECKSIFVKDEEGKFSIKEKKVSTAIETGKNCPKCKKGKIVIRKGAYGDFYTCNNYPACKTVFEKDGNGFSVKPFKKKFTSSSGKTNESDDNDSGSDNKEEIEE